MRSLITTASLAVLALAVPGTGRAATTVRTGGEAPIAGDGHKVTQARPFTAVTAIRLEGAIDVEVEVGGPPALTVTIDENLQPRVETRLDGDTLIISTRSMHLEGAATVRITARSTGSTSPASASMRRRAASTISRSWVCQNGGRDARRKLA